MAASMKPPDNTGGYAWRILPSPAMARVASMKPPDNTGGYPLTGLAGG